MKRLLLCQLLTTIFALSLFFSIRILTDEPAYAALAVFIGVLGILIWLIDNKPQGDIAANGIITLMGIIAFYSLCSIFACIFLGANNGAIKSTIVFSSSFLVIEAAFAAAIKQHFNVNSITAAVISYLVQFLVLLIPMLKAVN